MFGEEHNSEGNYFWLFSGSNHDVGFKDQVPRVKFASNNLGAALLAGFIFLGLIRIPPLHWRWLFWVPAGIALVIGTCMALIVKDTPEEAHFPPVNPDEEIGGRVQVKVSDVFKIIATNPVVWIIACAYACTGAVRQSIDQWFPLFMLEVHHVAGEDCYLVKLRARDALGLIPTAASLKATPEAMPTSSNVPSCWFR